jgi:nitrogen fixation-related uncharacterized protein
MSAFDNRLLLVWCSYTAVIVIALIPLIVWAIRSGQFSDNTAASRLPLRSGIPEAKEESKNVST